MNAQRRELLRLLGTGALVSAVAAPDGDAEVNPGEDLMQEHGVLQRLLLIYDDVARRLETGQAVDTGVAAAAARIVYRFVENYHERAEETHVFPLLERHKTLVPLVRLLKLQHARGREVTARILELSRSGGGGLALAQTLRTFERMYRPHAAREDTVLIPAFRKLLGRNAYRELGERMEDDEHRLLGDHGFEQTVDEVERLEGALGIGDLAQFTPT
jgi:hemerythrin-like domain-containing protein